MALIASLHVLLRSCGKSALALTLVLTGVTSAAPATSASVPGQDDVLALQAGNESVRSYSLAVDVRQANQQQDRSQDINQLMARLRSHETRPDDAAKVIEGWFTDEAGKHVDDSFSVLTTQTADGFKKCEVKRAAGGDVAAVINGQRVRVGQHPGHQQLDVIPPTGGQYFEMWDAEFLLLTTRQVLSNPLVRVSKGDGNRSLEVTTTTPGGQWTTCTYDNQGRLFEVKCAVGDRTLIRQWNEDHIRTSGFEMPRLLVRQYARGDGSYNLQLMRISQFTVNQPIPADDARLVVKSPVTLVDSRGAATNIIELKGKPEWDVAAILPVLGPATGRPAADKPVAKASRAVAPGSSTFTAVTPRTSDVDGKPSDSGANPVAVGTLAGNQSGEAGVGWLTVTIVAAAASLLAVVGTVLSLQMRKTNSKSI